MFSGTFWTFVLYLIYSAEAGVIGDQCDWTGSGLSQSSSDERAVTPVYLRCREGVISWKYPRGALRLLFRPVLPGDEEEFSVCVRIIRRDDPPDLFHTVPVETGPKPERFPAQLFVETPKKLRSLYASEDGDPREVRCFRSRRGHAAVYVEAEPETSARRRVATLRYHARPLRRRHYDPDSADCRPCNDEDLELAFCTSDLVSRGVIVGNELRPELDSTRLTWNLTKLIRASNHEGMEEENSVDDYYRYDTDSPVRVRRATLAHVHVRAACEAAAGDGDFLLMATRVLGRYSLVCAPRLQDWKELVKRRQADGNALCMLEH